LRSSYPSPTRRPETRRWTCRSRRAGAPPAPTLAPATSSASSPSILDRFAGPCPIGAVALVGAIATAGRALLDAAVTVEPSSPEPVDVPARQPTVGQTYVVKPGDTLWSIAAAIAPDSDPRPVVDTLREQNGGPDLQVGERLTIRTD
jgi:Tfp pilus assembly protein FimV